MHRKKRRENFDYNETKLLLKLWGDPEMQENIKSNYVKTPFIEKIATELRMHGYNRSTKEVETRLRTMKCSYTRIRKDLDAGWIIKPTWKYFNDVHVILGSSIVKNEQLYQQSTEPLDLSTSPTIANSITSKTLISKSTTKRTYIKKWIPVPLKVVKREKTTSKVPHLKSQHSVPYNNNVVINETPTEQVLSINDNCNGNAEPHGHRNNQPMTDDGLGNKDGTNQGKTLFQEKNLHINIKMSFQYQSTKST